MFIDGVLAWPTEDSGFDSQCCKEAEVAALSLLSFPALIFHLLLPFQSRKDAKLREQLGVVEMCLWLGEEVSS